MPAVPPTATEIGIMANDRQPWGATIALDVYCASLKGKPAQLLDGLTGDQHVFLGWCKPDAAAG